MIFFLKKLITSCILPPGIFVLIFIFCGSYFTTRRKRLVGMVLLVSGAALYIFSIPAVSDRFIAEIEWRSIDKAAFARCDVIVVLGGGVVERVEDLTGSDILSRDAAVRTMDAARLYHAFALPVITSGGAVEGSAVEAYIAKRMLEDLGVPARKIITESSSHDTKENARYVKEIMDLHSLKRPILVTSAYHMRRALKDFSTAGMDAQPYPSGMLGEIRPLHWNDLLPNANALRTSSLGLKELIGRMMQ